MKSVFLQKTKIKTSKLGFGVMRRPTFKKDPVSLDEAALIELIEYAYANGITYFDTAENYIKHKSEFYLGQITKYFREKITIATKVGIWHIKDSIADVESWYCPNWNGWVLNI